MSVSPVYPSTAAVIESTAPDTASCADIIESCAVDTASPTEAVLYDIVGFAGGVGATAETENAPGSLSDKPLV